MATTITSSTFSDTYKDDYSDSAGYHRILFNSGKALQARELTQLQTILQNQIERIGNNLFKEGSIIHLTEGGVALNQKYEFIKLNTTVNTLPSTPSDLVGNSFTGQTSGVIVKVLEVVEASGGDPATLYVQYTSTLASGAATTAPIRMSAGEDISDGTNTLTVQTTNTVANPAVGTGSQFSIGEGIYYAQGHFIYTEAQSKIISKYSDAPDADVGFKIIEDVVTTADTNALYDNQGSTPNVAAPGADRYRIRLVIATRADIASDENFIHVATIEEGRIASVVRTTDSYNIPNEMIAERIKENSGDYLVDPFTIQFETDSASGFLQLKVSEGVAVVDGYRAAKYVPTTIRVEKATDTTTINNDATGIDFGNYVIVNPDNTSGLPNIDSFERMIIRNATTFGGSTIGTARVRAITEDGSNYKYHLFDIQMNSGQDFRDAKSIGTSSSNYFDIVLENSKAVLKETSNNTLLFDLAHPRAKSLSDISLQVQRRFTNVSVSGGQAVLTGASHLTGSEEFVNTGDWLFAKADSSVYTGSYSITGAGTTTATISGISALNGETLEVIGYVDVPAGGVKNKNLTAASITTTIDSDGSGFLFADLDHADIYKVRHILDADSADLSPRFTVDNGQRDNFYAYGRLLLKSGQSAPSGNITVKYDYFNHTGTGNFFAAPSYTGEVAYGDIPSHRLDDGTVKHLRSVLDFRSVKDNSNPATFPSATIFELPQPGQIVRSDTEYYLEGAARLVIDTEGTIRYIKGVSGFNSQLPAKPEQTLGLYDIYLGPNTLNDSDTIIEKVESKRYTMADIARLEDRIDKIEELTSLSMLELETTKFDVLDSSGNDRTKSGVIVDNFSTQQLSDTSANDYRASIDLLDMNLRPKFTEDNIRLAYDSANSTNIIRKGDNLYLKHSESAYIDQSLASQSVRLNPFTVVVHEGVITLSPSSDEWRDTNRLAAKVVSGGTKLNTNQALLWNNWEWNWGGKEISQLKVGSATNAKVTTSGNTTLTQVNRVVSDETVRKFIGDRVLDIALLPFMRSKKVFFKAEGLRPNSKVFAFFDGIDVSNWVRSETFDYYSSNTTDYGNIHDNATQHPEGKSALETDANGTIEGSFFIPNTSAIRFRTGVREFKVLDISVNRENDALSIARAIYTATGYLDTKQKEFISTRVLTIEGSTSAITRHQSNNDDRDHLRNHDNRSYYNIPGTDHSKFEIKSSGRVRAAHGSGGRGGRRGSRNDNNSMSADWART